MCLRNFGTTYYKTSCGSGGLYNWISDYGNVETNISPPRATEAHRYKALAALYSLSSMPGAGVGWPSAVQ